MDQWTPEEVSAHMQYMSDFADRLEGTGEFVDGQALAPDGMCVRYDGEGRPPVTDGPFAETKDLIAGWMVIDVDNQERAIELAGRALGRSRGGREADPRVARGAPVPDRATDHHGVTSELNEVLLRSLTPSVLGILVRRGADFAAAEDAVQDALVEAVRVWPADPPRDPKGWLVTVAWRRFLDATRADAARRRREDLVDEEPAPGPASGRWTTRSSSTSCALTRR